jgi:hypothetical protein
MRVARAGAHGAVRQPDRTSSPQPIIRGLLGGRAVAPRSVLELQRLAGNRAATSSVAEHRRADGWQTPLGALTVQTAIPRTPYDARHLTAQEKAAADSVFRGVLDTSAVEISESRVIASFGYARTVYNRIYFPSGGLEGDYLPWLIHELTHVWQYQRGADLPGMVWEAVVGIYDYGGEEGLREAWRTGKAFDEFTTEQQGDIMEDYYKALRSGRSTAAYDDFVTQVRTGQEKVHRYPRVEPLPAGTLDVGKLNREYAARIEAKIIVQLHRRIDPGEIRELADRRHRLLWLFHDLSGYMSIVYRDRIAAARPSDELVTLLRERISGALRAPSALTRWTASNRPAPAPTDEPYRHVLPEDSPKRRHRAAPDEATTSARVPHTAQPARTATSRRRARRPGGADSAGEPALGV